MEKFLGSSQLIIIMTVINLIIALVVWSLYKKSVKAMKNQKAKENEDILATKIEEPVEKSSEEVIAEMACLEKATEEDKPEEVPEEIVAAIAAALAAMGYPMAQIASIRPRKQNQWKLDGRMHNMV